MNECACCWQPADKERNGSWFCAKCLAEIEELEKPVPEPEPAAILEIPGVVTIKMFE